MQVLYSSGRSSETRSVETVTSMHVRLDTSRACHCSAGINPRSSSIDGRKSRDMFRTIRTVFSTKPLIVSRCFESCSSDWLGSPIDKLRNSTSTAESACPTSSCNSRANDRRSVSCAWTRRAERFSSCFRACTTSSYWLWAWDSSFRIFRMLKAAMPMPKTTVTNSVRVNRFWKLDSRPASR